MFKISTRARYGLRALLELAKHNGKEPINLKDIAANQEISIKYLESIFKLLKDNKIIKSTRGPGGGYQLVDDPAELNIYNIFVALDGPLTTIDCVSDVEVCNRTENCRTRLFWEELQNHITGFLKSKTLQDIIETNPDDVCTWYAYI